MDKAVTRTAIGGRAGPPGAALRLEDAGLCGMVTLRGDLSDGALAAAVREATGQEVPDVRRFTLAGETGVFWMAPDELMLRAPYEKAGETVSALRAALAGTVHMAVDVSDARQVMRLIGDGAREVLAKGAPIDLHVENFGVGDIRRTRIAQVAAAIYQTGSGPERFEVFCFRSYADYLWRWLAASMQPGALPGVLGSHVQASD